MNAMTGLSPDMRRMPQAGWSQRIDVLECIAVVDEAPQVKTFVFRADDGALPRYEPGQFVTLEIPAGPEPLMRTYTLSSTPSRPFSVSVTVKAGPASIGTRWMFENLRPGGRLRCHGPAGDFSHHRHAAAKYLFLSAGSGITPMMSMLRWMHDCEPWADVAFVSCARRPDELIFRHELELLAHRMPALQLGFLVEGRSGRDAWHGPVGRIDATRLGLLAPDFRDREVFCCGPRPFMDLARGLLEAAGFDMRRYHQESFEMPAPTPVVEAPAAPAATRIPVRFALSARSGECLPGQTILQAARAAGVRIPAACESGLCGTCRTMKLSGDVVMEHNGGILDEEIEEGFILACCSRPLAAVEVEA